MQQLHLVGFTTDLESLILSARRGSKSGGFVVPLDDHLLEVVAEALKMRRTAAGEEGESALERALAAESAPAIRQESWLKPREIQARLRAGRTIEAVAAEAGVDEEWVERFAAPVFAERSQIIRRARDATFSTARKGESSEPLGVSVRWNVADRGVRLTDDEFDARWGAYQLQDELWVVRFEFVSRGRQQAAEWTFDASEATLASRNRLASDLGLLDAARRRRKPPEFTAPPRRSAPPEDPDAGATAEKPAQRPAKKAGRKATKKASSKASKAKKARKAKKASKGRTAKGSETARSAKRTAKKAAPAKRTAKKTPTRKAAAKKAAEKKATKKTAAAKKAGAKRAAGKSPSKAAKKTAAAKRTAKKVPAKAPVKKAAARKASPKRAGAKKAAKKTSKAQRSNKRTPPRAASARPAVRPVAGPSLARPPERPPMRPRPSAATFAASTREDRDGAQERRERDRREQRRRRRAQERPDRDTIEEPAPGPIAGERAPEGLATAGEPEIEQAADQPPPPGEAPASEQPVVRIRAAQVGGERRPRQRTGPDGEVRRLESTPLRPAIPVTRPRRRRWRRS